ncbi:MAG: MMPL family transporter [Thalassotalea sp.]|nr:MMPL family transporter [Thalassotalea sp.]
MHYSQFLQFALNKPKTIYAVVVAMVLISLAMIPQLTIDTDPENMLSSQNPERMFHNKIKNTFNMPDMIVVGVVSKESIYQPETLNILQQLSDKIIKIDGVIEQDLLSLSVVDNITQEANGGIRFEYLMQQAPKDLAGSKKIAQAVKRLPLLENTLVSGDEKAAAIYVPIKAKDLSYPIAEKIRAINQTFSDSDLGFHITGLPIAEDQFGYEMFVQMGIAAPLAGLAIFILLWYFFRNFPLIIAPMAVAMATVIIIMGSLIGLGFTVHIMTSMIAIFLMPIAVVDSVHILSEFSERYKEGDDVNQVIKKVMSHLFTPMLFTSITSAIGFYSLLLTPIPPVKIFGAFIGTGILLAFLLTVIYLPAYLSRLSPKALSSLQIAVARMEEKGRLSSFLQWLGRFSTNKTKAILFSFILLFIFSIVGVSKIEINDNPVNWFKADHEIRIADKVLNEHFAGTYDAWLVFNQPKSESQEKENTFIGLIESASKSGIDVSEVKTHISQWQTAPAQGLFTQELLIKLDDLAFTVSAEQQTSVNELYQFADQQFAKQKLFVQPEILNWLAELQTALNNTTLVGKTNGLTDIVKTVNRELHSGEDHDFVIPDSSNGVAQTLLQYQSSHRPNDLWHFVSQDYQQSLIWLQMTSGDNQHTTEVIEWVNDYISKHPAPIEVEMNWAGKSYLNIVWQDAMVNGMLNSLLSSFVIVFLMMVMLFRSIKYGVLAMLPLTFTISMIYGLIGWLGKSYDMPIAVLSALTLGLSIDFAIHFLQRARELEKETGSLSQALILMFEEPSRAISRNAIVIAIGFTPLLLSPLMPYITVGFFLASIMIVSALVTLVLLPALLTLFQKKQNSIKDR